MVDFFPNCGLDPIVWKGHVLVVTLCPIIVSPLDTPFIIVELPTDGYIVIGGKLLPSVSGLVITPDPFSQLLPYAQPRPLDMPQPVLCQFLLCGDI